MFKRIVLVAAPVVAAAGIAGATLHSPRSAPATPSASVAWRPPYDLGRTGRLVAFYAGRLRADPISAFDAAHLASAYLQVCRETGDADAARRAEAAARLSLRIRARRNASGYEVIAQCLQMEHRFAEARAAAEHALNADPADKQAVYIKAESDTELGEYNAAQRLLTASALQPWDAYGCALMARLKEIDGDIPAALALFRRATMLADRDIDVPRESEAWFHLREGMALAQAGQQRAAEQRLGEAVAIFPRDYRAMALLARLYACAGDWRAAVEWGTRAAAIVPTPDTVANLADAMRASGNPAEAATYERILAAQSKIASSQRRLYDRQRAIYYADHDTHFGEAVALARSEMRIRHDVYAYDTLGWVSLRAGDLRAAAEALKQALGHQTQDALLQYHAAAVALACGDRSRAAEHFESALRINPLFHPFGPARARSALTRLKLDPRPVSLAEALRLTRLSPG